MKAILQRVKSASVTVDQKLVSQIGKGLLVLAAVGHDDTRKEADSLAQKILKLRMWDDGSGDKVGVTCWISLVGRDRLMLYYVEFAMEEECHRCRR